MQRTFDVQAVRDQFPALGRVYNGRGVVYFDGPGGSQVARQAIEAITGYMERGGANLHGVFPTSTETEEMLADTRMAAADFLGAAPEEVAFGANMTTLTFEISRALARGWDRDSEIVVTELDHRANVDPWLIAAAEQGARVRWVRVDPETLTLDENDLEQNINERTNLVAIDAVHAAPHIPLDRDALGADIITCSAYKFFGPHVGVTAIGRDLFEKMGVYRLDPAPDHIPDKLETGTQNHEGIAGVKGALDFISSLGEGASQREKLASAMKAIEEHEAALVEFFRASLRDIPSVKLYAAPDSVRKTPTIAFRVEGHTTEEVCLRMLEHGFFIAAGDFYASTLAQKLGIGDSGGFVRAGLAPYNTEEEVGNFIESLARFVRET